MGKEKVSDQEIIGEVVKAITGKNFYCVVLQEQEDGLRAINWARGVNRGVLLTFATLELAKRCKTAKEFTMKMAKLTGNVANDVFDLEAENFDDDDDDEDGKE